MMDNFCLFGHVHKTTLLFGLFCILYAASNIYKKYDSFSQMLENSNKTRLLSEDFVEKYPNYKDYFVAETLIQSIGLIVVSFLLVVGNRLKITAIYWPFIMYMFLAYIITVCRIIFIIGIFVYSTIKRHSSILTTANVTTNKTIESKFKEEDRYEMLGILVFGLILCAVVQFYIAWIAEKDRRYLVAGEEDAKMDDLIFERNEIA